MEILATDRLRLRRLRGGDETCIHRIWNRPEVRRYLWDDQPVSLEIVRELLARNDQHFADDRYGLWLVCPVHRPETTVGFAGLWHFFEEEKPQLLYGLMAEYQGKGYATEAAAGVLAYAFDILGFDGLRACTDPPNQDSARVLQRLSFQLEGERLMDGKPTLFWWKNASTG